MNTKASAVNGSQIPDILTMDSCCSMIDCLPAGSCLLSIDTEHVVLHANEKFYQLIGHPKSEFQYRFGGRLSAVTAGEWPFFTSVEDGMPVELEYRLRSHGDEERWVHIDVRPVLVYNEPLLLCILTDISTQKSNTAESENYRGMFYRASNLTGSETFAYDIVTQRATIFYQGTIFKQISPEDHERYDSFQQIFIEKDLVDKEDEQALINAFTSICRREAAVCEVRMYNGNGKLHWVRLSMELKEPGDETCQTAVGILQNVTELKAATLHCLGEAQFLQAILSEKDAYIQVDISTDKMLRVGGRWFLYSGLIHSISYSCLLEKYLGKTIYQEDVDYYLEFMGSDNLLHSMNNGIERLSCRVRRNFEQNDTSSWVEIDIFLFKNPFSQNIEALICSQRLDRSNSWTSVPGQASTDVPQRILSPESYENTDPVFEHFLSEKGDIAYLVDMDSFELLMGNEALYRSVGLTKRECIGKTCYWVMHHRESPCPFCGRANWSRDGFHVWKNWNTALQQNFLVKNRIVSWQGRDVLLAIAVDISQNKGFLDSVGDGGGESHGILSGIQRMSEGNTLEDTIQSALETIGCFFGAGAVQYWTYQWKEETFCCSNEWKLDDAFLNDPRDQRVSRAVNQWMHKIRWTYPVDIENQEAMLCHSFEMYELLKESGIWNQRWIPLREGDNLWGIFVIANISNHFQNTSFMDIFSTFILEEWRNKARVDEMVYASNHDDLTDFLNWKSYEQFVHTFSSDDISSLGVVSVYINNLVDINRHHGFQMGDDCIRHFASKFLSAFQEGTLFRLRGGEFVAILTDFSFEKLSDRLEELEDDIVSCRRYAISTGYSWDNIEKELPVLVRQASQSMNLKKQQQFDTSSSSSSDEERRLMIQNLMLTLENKKFEVFLQPKVNLYTDEIMGAEALVRYRDKQQGIIPPSRFIDVLEKNNLIRFVDLFVFEECCRVLERWKDTGIKLPVISFNFSRLTLLERDIVSSVQAIFRKYHIPKENVEIEITESVADLGKGVLYQAAHQLYQAGFSISLDDFGTKYTNLDILSELDFDMLKVDKSLVSLLTKRRSNQIILQNIITMCRHLNISVIAEGIETKSQEAVLRSLGCKYGQGYLYGRPMPISEFEDKFITSV